MTEGRQWEVQEPVLTQSSEPTSKFSSAGYWASYIVIVICVLLVNVFTQADRFADFDNYILYLNGLVHFPLPNWIYFETLSNLFFLGMYGITQSVFSAMVLAHYGLGIIFVLAILVAFPPRQSSWPALLFTFAMLGPLLAFVTVRATPAYFLVAIGVRFALNRRPVAWLCLLVATFFHISTLLALVPMALLYFERNLPMLLRSGRSRRYYLLVTLTIVAFSAVLSRLSSSLTSVIQSIPVIAKYDIYTDSVVNKTQIAHYIFLVFVLAMTIGFMTVRNNVSNRLNMYVLVSFALYVVMFFSASPVAAFRQAPFWMMPMIASLPWDKLGVNQSTAAVFVLACAGLFFFQFGLVYI